MKKSLKFLYFFVFSIMLFTVTAQAYIDPSAMTYIIQIVAGMAIAAGAAFGFYFRKIKRAINKLKNKDKANDNWEYDETDNDDFGMGEYPVLDIDKWDDDDLSEIPVTADASDTYNGKFDPYHEDGGDFFRENEDLRHLLAEEKAKNRALSAKIKALKS